MKRRLKGFVAIFIPLTILFLAAAPVGATSVSSLEKEKEKIEQQKREADERKKKGTGEL